MDLEDFEAGDVSVPIHVDRDAVASCGDDGIPVGSHGGRPMLEHLTHESFRPHVGTPFRVEYAPAASATLTLFEVTVLGGGGTAPRQPFSLLFRGPRAPVLPQRIYRLEHEGMGALELFIVPIGPDAEGLRYEAIFT